MLKVGFIGLGTMGFPIAGHISKSYKTLVFNRTTNKSHKWTSEFEGEICESVKEIALKSEVIFLCLSEDRDIEEVVLGSDGILEHLNERTIVVDHSTTSVDTATLISRELLNLIEEFTEISYRALKNEINSLEKHDWTDWLMSYFNTIFISRSTEPIEGDHTDAILSRIDDALKSGKLENAKIEISNLSSETRALMKDWIRKLDKLIEMEDQINQ